jgi:hypothetical protein
MCVYGEIEMGITFSAVVNWIDKYFSPGTAILLIIGIFIASSIHLHNYWTTVVSTTDVGQLITVQFHDGTSTSVETDRGSFLVYGTFQTTKGQTLVIKDRVNGRPLLCVQATDYCKEVWQ